MQWCVITCLISTLICLRASTDVFQRPGTGLASSCLPKVGYVTVHRFFRSTVIEWFHTRALSTVCFFFSTQSRSKGISFTDAILYFCQSLQYRKLQDSLDHREQRQLPPSRSANACDRCWTRTPLWATNSSVRCKLYQKDWELLSEYCPSDNG